MSTGTRYYVYCDESRTTQDRFMVFGAIITTAASRDAFNERLRRYRTKQHMLGEMKWTKVSEQKLPEYGEFVNEFFRVQRGNIVHFRSIVLDTFQIDYKKFHGGDRDLGRYKFFYHFLLHTVGRYVQSDADRIHIVFDEFRSPQSLSEFGRILNYGICKKYNLAGKIVATVEPVCSHDCDIIQVADVFMGAVGFHFNDRHTFPGAKKAKILLAQHIARMARLPSLKQSTPPRYKHFGIWPFRLQ